MGKGKRRTDEQEQKRERTEKDLVQHKGFSKYQRKKMEQDGVDMNKLFGGSA